MNQNFKTYHLKITTLSPVHIGSSEEYEPTNYVICSENPQQTASVSVVEKKEDDFIICEECGYKNPKGARTCGSCDSDLPYTPVAKPEATNVSKDKGILYTFTPNEVKQALSKEDMGKMLQVSKSGSLQKVQTFFYQNRVKIAKTAKKRAIVAPDVFKEYNEKAGKEKDTSNDFNSLRIEKVICNDVTGIPYIPGSSLKGAIRTAWLNSLEQQKKYQCSDLGEDRKKRHKVLEKKLLNFKSVTEDPFKEIKISDAVPMEDFMTSVEKATNKKRKQDKASRTSIPTSIELVSEGITFEADVNFVSQRDENWTVCSSQYDMDKIAKACNEFSQSLINIDSEDQVIHHGISDAFFKNLKLKMQQPNTFVMKIGKHTGAEGMTIGGLRSIKIMGKKGEKPQYKSNATTFWFADNGKQLRPFGWVVVEFTEVK